MGWGCGEVHKCRESAWRFFSVSLEEVMLVRSLRREQETHYLQSFLLVDSIPAGTKTLKVSSKLDITPADIPYHHVTPKTQHPTSPTPSLHDLIPLPQFRSPSAILLRSRFTPYP